MNFNKIVGYFLIIIASLGTFVFIFTMDNFIGISACLLAILGKINYDWGIENEST